MLLDQPDRAVWHRLFWGLAAAMLVMLFTQLTLAGPIGAFFWTLALLAERRHEARRSAARLRLVAFLRVAARSMMALFLVGTAALVWLVWPTPQLPDATLEQPAMVGTPAFYLLQLAHLATVILTTVLCMVCYQSARSVE